MTTFFYTETAFHHEGDVEFMRELITESAKIGADGIKFQVLLDYDEFISTNHPMYTEFKKALISKQDWLSLINYAQKLGLKVVFMPCDTESVKFISELNTPPAFLDIHSVSFYDANLLQEIKKTNIPIILGIGGRTEAEIHEKISFFEGLINVLMVGYQSFPTKLEDAGLSKISYLKKKFPGLEIGYADHSETNSEDEINGNSYACILGANFFEKHITTKPGMQRFDWQSAASVQNVKRSIDEVTRLRESILANTMDDVMELSEGELVYRNRQKVLVFKKGIERGEILTEKHVILKMIGTENGETQLSNFLGKRLLHDVQADDVLTPEHFTNN